MMPATKTGFDWRSFLRDNWFFIAVFVALIILPHAIGWLTGSSPFGQLRGERFVMRGESTFWQSVFIEIFALSILVISYNLMFGYTGVVSFGHALFFGMGGYVIGILLEVLDVEPTLGIILGTLLTLGLSAVVGIIIGFATLRLKGVYFAIFTLAVAEMVWIYFARLDLTNGEDGLTLASLPTWIDPSQNRLGLYYIALIAFAVCFALIKLLMSSPTGSVFKAIRDNEERTQAIGYHTLRFKLFAITAAGMMAGVAGILHALLAKAARPEFLSVRYTVDALLMTIIGGVGTLTGPILGAGGLHLADVTFRDLQITLGETVINISDSWTLILGFIFVLVVLVFPYGIVGTWMRWRAKRRTD